MISEEQYAELSHRKLEIRAKLDSDAAKCLFLMNGGGAIALTEYSKSEFDTFVVFAVFLLMIGVVLSVFLLKTMREGSLVWQLNNMQRNSETDRVGRQNKCLFYGSMAMFILAGVMTFVQVLIR